MKISRALLLLLLLHAHTVLAGIYDTKYFTVATVSIPQESLQDAGSRLNGTDIKDYIQNEVHQYLQSQASKAVDYVIQTFVSLFQDSDSLFDDLTIVSKFNTTPFGRRLLQWIESNDTNLSYSGYNQSEPISQLLQDLGMGTAPEQLAASQDLYLSTEPSPGPAGNLSANATEASDGFLQYSETVSPYNPNADPLPDTYYYYPGDNFTSGGQGSSAQYINEQNPAATDLVKQRLSGLKKIQTQEMLDFWRSFTVLERQIVSQGIMRRRLHDLVSQSNGDPANTTYVLVALQSQSWDQMQLLTSTLNSNLFAQQVNSRQLLQVSVLSSTTSLVVPGEGEALNVLKQSSPSLQTIVGLTYSNQTQTWTSKVKHYSDPTHDDYLQAIYFTKPGGAQPGDRLNPCIQPTSTVNCIYDMQVDYYTSIYGLPTSYSVSMTAQELISSLPNRSFMELYDSEHGIKSYYASEEDRLASILTIEIKQTAIELYIGTLSSSSNALSTYQFGIGMLVIRSNPTTIPDAIADFSLYEVLSTNHYTFSVKSSQDYTYLQYFSAVNNKVLYPSLYFADQQDKAYYTDINFVIPDGYSVDAGSLQQNIISYIGPDQRTFADPQVWTNPCGLHTNLSSLITEECRRQVQMDFCSPIVHDFMNRKGVFVTIRVPVAVHDDLDPTKLLYISILLKLISTSSTFPEIYTNIVTSVRLGNYVTRCQQTLLPNINLDNRFVKLKLSIGLALETPFTSTFTVKDFLDALTQPTDAAYHIDLTGKQDVRSITESLFTMNAIGDEGFFQANPQKYLEIQQVYSLHTLSNETRDQISSLLQRAEAFYTTPPSTENAYTQVTFTEAINSICSEVFVTQYNQSKPCVIRHEIKDSAVVNPYFAHYIDGTDSDVYWLTNILGTSSAAIDLATNISSYRSPEFMTPNFNPRYNKGFWVYPAFQWPDKNILDITDYVFLIVSFSVKTDTSLPTRRRLLQVNNDMDSQLESQIYEEGQERDEPFGDDKQQAQQPPAEDLTDLHEVQVIQEDQLQPQHDQDGDEEADLQQPPPEEGMPDGDGRRLLAHPRSRTAPAGRLPHAHHHDLPIRPKHLYLDHRREDAADPINPARHKKGVGRRLIGEEEEKIKDRRYRKKISIA